MGSKESINKQMSMLEHGFTTVDKIPVSPAKIKLPSILDQIKEGTEFETDFDYIYLFKGESDFKPKITATRLLTSAHDALEIFRFRTNLSQNVNNLNIQNPDVITNVHFGMAAASSYWYLSKRLGISLDKLINMPEFSIATIAYNQLFHLEDSTIDDETIRFKMRSESADFPTFVHTVLETKPNKSVIAPIEMEKELINKLQSCVEDGTFSIDQAQYIFKIYSENHIKWLLCEYETIMHPDNSNYESSLQRQINNAYFPSIMQISIIGSGLGTETSIEVVSDCLKASYIASIVDHMLDIGEDMSCNSWPLIEQLANSSGEKTILATLVAKNQKSGKPFIFDFPTMTIAMPKTSHLLRRIIGYNLSTLSKDGQQVGVSLFLLSNVYPLLSIMFGAHMPVVSETFANIRKKDRRAAN